MNENLKYAHATCHHQIGHDQANYKQEQEKLAQGSRKT